MSAIPTTIPHGRTAQRLTWPHLPPAVRAYIERRCGSPVVDAASQGGGFTPGFASVLTCADGSRHFVKAASTKAQKLFAGSYREEARKLQGTAAGRARPASVVAARRRLGGARHRVRRGTHTPPSMAAGRARRLLSTGSSWSPAS